PMQDTVSKNLRELFSKKVSGGNKITATEA
ncbi:uncharacterized protein METZ01_LOCUS402691, partial [marine metagenome]